MLNPDVDVCTKTINHRKVGYSEKRLKQQLTEKWKPK